NASLPNKGTTSFGRSTAAYEATVLDPDHSHIKPFDREVEALATITTARIEDFVWTHICCRFSIPYAIITDNAFFFASPAHPQSNDQVEAITRSLRNC
ncbi:unnamed protein product, partial [Prunus brigantina]